MGEIKKTNNILQALFCLVLGWFGLDKLFYCSNLKLGIIKFLSCFILVGIVWNCYDIVCALQSKYEAVPSVLSKTKAK